MPPNLANPLRHQLRTAVYLSRDLGGIKALRELLGLQLAALNERWPHAAPEDIAGLQGEARALGTVIKYFEQEPLTEKTRQ